MMASRIRYFHVGVNAMNRTHRPESMECVQAPLAYWGTSRVSMLCFCMEGAHRSAYLAAGIIMGATQRDPDTTARYLKDIRTHAYQVSKVASFQRRQLLLTNV